MSIISLSILLASVLAGPVPLGHAQQVQDERITVDRLLAILDDAGRRVEEAFSRVKSLGVSVPLQAEQKYKDGLSMAKEAVQLRDQGKLNEAKGKALQALQSFKAAMLNVAPQLEKAQTPAEIEALKSRSVEATAQRLEEATKRMEEAVARAEGRGLNTSNVKARLSETKALLEKVKGRIKAGEIDEAAKEIEAGEKAFGQSMAALRPTVEKHKENQAKEFLKGVEEHLDEVASRASGVLQGLLDKVPASARKGIEQALQSVNAAIERAKTKVSEAKKMVEQGKVQEAMPKLGELRGDVAKIMSEVKRGRPELGTAMENLDKRESAIKALEGRAEKLSKRGVDTSSLRAKVNEAKAFILNAVEKLKQHDSAAVDQILRKIDAIVDEARSLADQLERR